MNYASISHMESMPEMAAGSWASNIFVDLILTALDSRFPGAKDLILKYADMLPLTKIWAAIQLALVDYQAGKDFLTILQDEIAKWLTPDQIRMMAAK